MFGIHGYNYLAATDEFRRRVHPDDLAKVLNAIDYAKRNKEPYIAEFRVFHENGNICWVIAGGQFYYAKDNQAERLLGVAVDITERKLAEEALASVSGRLIQAQEQERARIARELHDDINQRLSILQIDLVRIG
jgi:PAS domain S-box-containing protein